MIIQMKSFIKSVALWSAAVCIIPLAANAGRGERTEPASADISLSAQQASAELPSDKLKILSCAAGEIRTVSVEEYTVFAVLEEIPDILDTEAMKAQACAARTYAARRILSGEDSLTGAHMTDDENKYQPCFTEEQARAVYGSRYEEAYAAAEAAAVETAGEIITFSGLPVSAPFHVSSGETTESAESAWGTDIPYLTAAVNPEKAVFSSERLFTYAELGARICAEYPDAAAPEEVILEYRENSGIVNKAKLCGITLDGAELAHILSLDSGAYEVSKTDGGYLFTVSGQGHLVGMSMAGAQQMALEGYSYKDILSHYYPGTEISVISLI